MIYYWITKPINRIKRFGDIGIFVGKMKVNKPYRRAFLEQLKKYDLLVKYHLYIQMDGQQLTLLRSETGKVYLINSYCPHLGANFNVGGRVVDNNCIQCPFHGWIFNAETGICKRIPYESNSTIPEQAKISIWPIVEKICIFMLVEIPDIDEISNGEWKYRGRTEHEINCHIQDIPENGADIAHLNYLHLAGINKGNDISKIEMENPEPIIRHIWDGRWEQQSEPNKHIGVMYLKQVMTIMKIPIPFTYSDLQARQIGPGIVHMMFNFGILGRGIVLQHLTPEEPLFQRSRFVMYSNLPKIYANFFLLCESIHFERDIFIWNHKCYVKRPLLTKNDGPIMKHRRWYNQFYTDNSPRLESNDTLSNEVKSIFDCFLMVPKRKQYGNKQSSSSSSLLPPSLLSSSSTSSSSLLSLSLSL
ncbi:Cholesterol desaturase daf-36 [Dirofilaria immitis]|nr:Cholesterol desaturase daf-36 [Dirofilaria immitis]